ncbi:MAG TPA: hypothetical protein VL475_06155, partial [Planctomycetaceae bacterium]|nr:hypothetical protein [Planctomycetaceae bacterium]
MPLPCAHPNCHILTYAYRSGSLVMPLTRFIEPQQSLDLLANGITFTRPRARQLIESYLGKMGCCAGGSCGDEPVPLTSIGKPPAPAGNGTNAVGFENGRPGLNSIAGLEELLSDESLRPIAEEFFTKALSEQLSPRDVFRITITSFLDPYNFDLRRLMKCCIHHVLPSGHVIPFCAYNVLYREGHVPLPELRDRIELPVVENAN